MNQRFMEILNQCSPHDGFLNPEGPNMAREPGQGR